MAATLVGGGIRAVADVRRMLLTQKVVAEGGMALGLQGAMVVEIFPLRTRVTSMSVAYSVTLALAGGTAPLVSTWLIDTLGEPLARNARQARHRAEQQRRRKEGESGLERIFSEDLLQVERPDEEPAEEPDDREHRHGAAGVEVA